MLTDSGRVIMDALGVKDEEIFRKMIEALKASELFTEEEVTSYLNGIIFTSDTDKDRTPNGREMDD